MSQGYSITINGVTHNQREWCRIYNIDPSTVKSRMWRHNIPFEEALINCETKIASFNSQETFEWFVRLMTGEERDDRDDT